MLTIICTETGNRVSTMDLAYDILGRKDNVTFIVALRARWRFNVSNIDSFQPWIVKDSLREAEVWIRAHIDLI
jgi:hypothetical protein